MCMKEGEEENELKENKQIKYLSKHCLFVRTKHLSFSTTIIMYYAVYKTTTQPCQSIMI